MKPDYENKIVACCLCGREIPYKESCNPWPLCDIDDAVCCHDCDNGKVIPARLGLTAAEWRRALTAARMA